jgi:hypothetical protein
MVDQATASAPATRQPQPAAGPAVMMSQQDYLNSKADPAALKRFVLDWAKLGGRGIIGGDGQPASYWDVYQDLSASGIDVSDLPTPDSLPQGMVKGGGSTTSLESQPAPAAAPAGPTPAAPNPEMTDLLSKLGVDYPNAPGATPALLAFLRNLGLNLDSAAAAKQASIDRIQRASTDASSRLGRVGEQEKKNVTADLIRRGVLQSGEANTRFSQQAQTYGERSGDIERTRAEAAAQAGDVYTNALNVARTQATGQVMQTELEQKQQDAAAKAQAEQWKQQQAAADLAYQRSQEALNAQYAKQEELLKKYGSTP